jgi:hypothetical protein
VAGGWRKLHNEEPHNSFPLPNIISVINSRLVRWAGHVEHIGGMRNANKILVEISEGQRPLGRPRRG